ncbi:hypothetical protein T4E_6027 [Trichinella pseudospiralis]|uniref:Uncharacterized protein n=1 Tax=Trichinella pseudospiralis TaxID=6337 RepID=A0A0V0XEX5_TRIPS|nr:hypothetical protein T4E_2503 [Trichinella pseudospiralis]KRX86563.1 hypothetical protein T4E_6027 [Trichinella pseudospiralis]
MEKQTMIVVGARSLNPLGVRHIGLECLGQGSAAHLCCLRRSVWLLLIVFVSIRDQWPLLHSNLYFKTDSSLVL